MKVYTAAIIDKPQRSVNSRLRKKVASELRKALHTSSKNIASQELNSFVFVSGVKNGKNSFNKDLIERVEKGLLKKQLIKYYRKNEARFKSKLNNNQEIRETSQIIKNFVKDIDSNLPRRLDSQLSKINSDLPERFKNMSAKSFITLWDIEETQEYRFYLSGFDFPIFTGKTSETQYILDVSKIVDQILIVNFFNSFLKPTIEQIANMIEILKKLEHEIKNQHFKTDDNKLQEKFELFLRILVAKLSALQELENLIRRIFNLFDIPRTYLSHFCLKSDFLDFNSALYQISEEISDGNSKLQEVNLLIQKCQLCIRDYLDEGVNGVKTTNSVKEFQGRLAPIAALSIDLFIQAELLKIWSDFFGSDLPYFSFNAQLVSISDDSGIESIEDDVILAARGLFKNYYLGQNTVYALRGLNLDIKQGEFVAIVGNSGAGKTTLLNCLASLDSPDHGKVYYRKKDIQQMSDSEKSKMRLKEMGFIFQSYALLPHFTTRENVALPADLAGKLSKGLRARIENLLEGVGINAQATQFPAQLSGGQMQRVAIARALTNRPTVIFADEPTGDLDSTTGYQVMALLKKFHEETGTTIVIITHEKDIAAYAKRQILMEDGIIIKR